MAAALGDVSAGRGAPEAIVIRRFGRSAARGRALQVRRQIAAEATDISERLLGRCEICGRAHAFPDHRAVCEACGRERCFAGCGHGREGIGG